MNWHDGLTLILQCLVVGSSLGKTQSKLFFLLKLVLGGIGRVKGKPKLNQQPIVAVTTVYNDE